MVPLIVTVLFNVHPTPLLCDKSSVVPLAIVTPSSVFEPAATTVLPLITAVLIPPLFNDTVPLPLLAKVAAASVLLPLIVNEPDTVTPANAGVSTSSVAALPLGMSTDCPVVGT